MEHNPAQPEPAGLDIETLPPVDVAQNDWPGHSLLRRARLNELGDGLEWPSATFEQLPLLREISLVVDDGVLCARLSRQFNFDRFVDASTDENGPAHPAGHVPDRQRFYTRVTDNGFHVVGVFSAATIGDRRRYFQWLTGAWVEIGLSGFLYVRDDLDTHFSEVSANQLDETQPGATATSMTAEEEWTVESVQSQFVGDPIVEPSLDTAGGHVPDGTADPAPDPATEAARDDDRQDLGDGGREVGREDGNQDGRQDDAAGIEPLTAATFPTLAAPNPVDIADLLPPPVAPAPIEAEPVDESSRAPEGPPPGSGLALVDGSTVAAIQRGIAVALATVAHRSDVDLVGSATIDHVARVADSFTASTDLVRHCAAWLHDALERSDLTERDLLEAGLQRDIVDVVSLLTRREGVADDAWLAAIAANADARAVKISAIRDNAAPWRLRRLDPAIRAGIERASAGMLAALGVA